jgi:hypothetical protein
LFSETAKNWELLSGNFWTQVLWVTALPNGLWGAPAAFREVYDDTVPFYTTPDGVTWTRSSTNASDVVLTFNREPVLNPTTGVYLASDNQVVYTSKDLKTWTSVFDSAMENLQGIQSLYLDATGSMWVLTAVGPRVDEIWTSVDDGANWERKRNCPTKLRRVFPYGSKKLITVQNSFYGYWFFVSADGGDTWQNTSTSVGSGENAWLANSKAILHIGSWNVTSAPLDLSTWTTQRLNVSSSANFLVFADTFYGIDTYSETTWGSADGVTWTLSDAPYFISKVHSIATSPTTLFAVGDNGVAISARQQ